MKRWTGGSEVNDSLPVLLRDSWLVVLWARSVRTLQTTQRRRSGGQTLHCCLSSDSPPSGRPPDRSHLSRCLWVLGSVSVCERWSEICLHQSQAQQLSLPPHCLSQVTSCHTPVNKRPRWLREQVKTAVIGWLVSRWVDGVEGLHPKDQLKRLKGVWKDIWDLQEEKRRLDPSAAFMWLFSPVSQKKSGLTTKQRGELRSNLCSRPKRDIRYKNYPVFQQKMDVKPIKIRHKVHRV